MKSPFPGMDPYLEGYWPDVHSRLVVLASNALQPQLPDGLFARIEEGLTIDAEDEPHRFRADVLVANVWPGDTASEQEGGVALVEPDEYRTIEQEVLRRVEIIDVRGGGHVVTVLEIPSPSNKGEGRESYRFQQRSYRDAGIHRVEIDLLRRGAHVLAVPLEEIPMHKVTPYAVCVTRGGKRGAFWVWHIGLMQRLPAIRIPLRPGDRDAVVDLQPLLDAAYRDGRYDRLIDYRKPIEPPLPPEAVECVESFVRAAAQAG